MARRNHRRSKVTRVINLIKRIIAFFFSHVGLCALVIGYALLGAVVFRAVEGPHETFIQGQEYGLSAQWTFTGAFLYSLTVITTIGYGNTSAKTYFGKTLTILFAIIGIPIMLLFLTNIGDIMAKIFRFFYARSIRLKYRLILWHKRRKATELRCTNSLVSRMTRDVNTDLSGDSFRLSSNVQDLLTARAQIEQLEVKESVEAQLQRISVPLSLVFFTMFAYLVAGSVLFCLWEGWTFLDRFGDKFPGASVGNDKDAQKKLVITSIYLLFGMALLAMCFNLAQEEVVNKVSWLANKFKSRDDEDYD
ncbi:unnamed protein product [Wuchereria bancrofti]|uniref:Potassium channel domain-containing protein n=1 Tax=Wuchereria bancrofti TaxID=6293 RepID=A0A3P7ECW3_WUCBA|nr:unnamed protein product [Wuchereria bancrofti]